MPYQRISQSTPRPSLEATDMIPVAAQGSTTAFHITGQALFDSIPTATPAQRGLVYLATQAETAAALVGDHAVTPAALSHTIGPKHLAGAFCSAGRSNSSPLTLLEINTRFQAVFGRLPATGDLITIADDMDNIFILAYAAAAPAWHGIDPYHAAFVSFAG